MWLLERFWKVFGEVLEGSCVLERFWRALYEWFWKDLRSLEEFWKDFEDAFRKDLGQGVLIAFCIVGLEMFVKGCVQDLGLGVLRIRGGLRNNCGGILQGL